MIILDTNVLSELMRPQPSQAVVAWVDAQPCDDLFISAITMAEILHGIERLPTGKRKDQLHVIAQALFDEDFADRVLPFDAHTAPRYAVWVATSQASGKSVSLRQVRQPGRCANSRYLYCTSGKPRDTQR